MEIWLSNGKDELLIPVNPASLGYEDTINYEDIVLASGDERTVIGGRNLRTYSIESFFPKRTNWYYVNNLGHVLTPQKYVTKFKSWMDSKVVLRLRVTTTGINELVTIRNFTWNEIAGTGGDIDYTLELKQYIPISFTKTSSSSLSLSANSTTIRPPSNSSTSKSGNYTVKAGDSLWKIAKKYYGNGDLWKKIYNANTKVIGSNPNNLKPGQVLVIPK